ncbi:MAG: efflux transporter periplasmic adaptor subunit [Rhizobiales bacterium 24-66-13]|jgi:macrolide-specific efflux system membrane fusion protein|nr:MAG: efflux transporter periplasmic adaptor subunit [Rhizobiales bacterium 35-66-30]OYZ73960.1 MAG: efflux transporter periplasmic adaptor subunit [Rhizobiales bacterium 24-66-13]HQS46727.1 efflux RND transporter periplasmic adaptor subunit [Xanthobacteraceae bacterium]
MLQKSEQAGVFAPPAGKRRGRRAWWIAGAVAVLAGAGGYYAYGLSGATATPGLATVPVVRGDIQQTVTALGTIKPKTYVDVGTQVSGQLRKVLVAIGDGVQKGQLVAQIDPTVYQTKVIGDQAQLDNLKAQLAQQRAQLDLDKLRDDRATRLLASKAGSQDTADAAAATVRIGEAKIAALQAQIKQTQATLDGDLANLGYTKIFAPITGTVVSITSVEGQTLNANQTAPIILRVADLDTMQVWAQVAEADIPKVKVGMEVYFTTLGMPDRRFTAKVVQVLPTPDTVNDVVLYNVLIDVPNPERLLMTSMSAQVFFMLGGAKDALLVPPSAVRPLARGGSKREARNEATVRVLVNGEVQTRAVKTGLSSRTQVQITEGLKEGELVVTSADPSAQRVTRGPGMPPPPF